MERLMLATSINSSSYYRILILLVWACSFQDVLPQKTIFPNKSHFPAKLTLSDPPLGIFGPIEISPSMVPSNPYPVEPMSPMYPPSPNVYEPALTGRCPVNFSYISSIMDRTAFDCSAPLAEYVGDVICCPQFNSLMHIFLGAYASQSGSLVLHQAAADDCFSDIINLLASRGANDSVPTLCSVKSSNLTGSSCPVKDTESFERTVNTSKLSDACNSIDPLKECCRPSCQPAIMEAALNISLRGSSVVDNPDAPASDVRVDVVNDCKVVVYAWLSRRLSFEAANTAFRMLSSCKVNEICPLEFKEPSEVIDACHNTASPNSSCCSTLNDYIATIEKQMLITNRQAINCATLFGSMLEKGGVATNIYELCNIELKDFSLQAYGQQGCLLRSLPEDITLDAVTGFSFTCDLSDNIAAPWPSPTSLSSLSLCAPEISLPALPLPQASTSIGNQDVLVGTLATFILCFVSSTL